MILDENILRLYISKEKKDLLIYLFIRSVGGENKTELLLLRYIKKWKFTDL